MSMCTGRQRCPSTSSPAKQGVRSLPTVALLVSPAHFSNAFTATLVPRGLMEKFCEQTGTMGAVEGGKWVRADPMPLTACEGPGPAATAALDLIGPPAALGLSCPEGAPFSVGWVGGAILPGEGAYLPGLQKEKDAVSGYPAYLPTQVHRVDLLAVVARRGKEIKHGFIILFDLPGLEARMEKLRGDGHQLAGSVVVGVDIAAWITSSIDKADFDKLADSLPEPLSADLAGTAAAAAAAVEKAAAAADLTSIKHQLAMQAKAGTSRPAKRARR